MYVVFVVLLLFVLPACCVAAEALWWSGGADIVLLVGKWFVFWAVGVRLFIAGLRQVVQPQFTAESIFDTKDEASSAIVREIGFANLAMGTLGLLTIIRPGWLLPAAIVGGLFYGLAGVGHAMRGDRNAKEQTALISDLLMFVLLGAFVAMRGF
jgi:hypothetical protein